ncbi:MAG: hypothetical protein GXY38_05750 [Planctomycetes bacterium]|nr:hypothetical protein [Planctomycetota bacterium]
MKLPSAVFFAIVLGAVACSAVAQDNLLSNAGFESGQKLPDGWTSTGAGAAWDSALRHGGGRSVRLNGQSGKTAQKWESSFVPITPHVPYVASAWVRTQSVLEKRGWLLVNTFDASKKWIRSYFIYKPDGSAAWREYSRAFTPKDGEVLAQFTVALRGTGTMWADDVSLSRAMKYTDGNGVLHIGGKPVFPIGLYTHPCKTDFFDEISQAGFNAVLPYTSVYLSPTDAKSYLDAAQRKGIHVIYALKDYMTPWRLDDPEVWTPRQKVVDVVSTLKNHPALLSWGIADEPELQGAGAIDMIETHSLIKQIDPQTPTSAAVSIPAMYGYYGRYVDVLMPDVYPIPHSTVGAVGDAVRAATAAGASSQPVWAVIQVFDPAAFGSKPEDNPRAPTYDEIRCMSYLAVVNGAKGLFYFCYDSQYKVYEHPEQWAGLKKIAGEIKTLVPVILAPPADLHVSVSPAEHVSTTTRLYDGKAYIFVVNKHNSPREMSVTICGEQSTSSVRLVDTQERIDLRDNRFVTTIPGYGAQIYSFELSQN